MQFTLHATRRTPHGASRMVQAMSSWLVKTRRAPSQHSRDARVYGHTATAIYKVYINDMIVAVEAAKEGVTTGEDTVSGFMFAHDFVRIPETPEGFTRRIAETDGKSTRVH